MPHSIPAINHLLYLVHGIRQRDEEIYRATGQNYNIFFFLPVETHENRLSRMLSEFLDPRGSHDRGDVFPREFLHVIQDYALNTVKP